MTSNVANFAPRGSQRELPHLPPPCRDPADDAREALAAFAAWQADGGDMSRTEIAESLAAALRALLPMLTRP